MRFAALLLVPVVSLAGCRSVDRPPRYAGAGAAADRAGAADRPGYTVAVTYSPRSLAELHRRHETVIVASYFSGQPAPGAPATAVSEVGDINLGDLNTEVLPGEPAHIAAVHFNPATLAQTNGKDPELLINVYSGRKSSPDNLLNCSTYQGPLAPVLKTTIPITCKLIVE